MNTPWGKEDDATLKRMAANGYSAADIATVLPNGRSRNAVCGRAWRLGVTLLGEKPNTPKKPRMVSNGGKPPAQRLGKRKLTPRLQLPSQPVNVEAFEAPRLVVGGTPEPVSLMELEDGMCKWPVGSKFCGCKTITPGKPYCPQHTYVSKLPPAQQPLKRANARTNW